MEHKFGYKIKCKTMRRTVLILAFLSLGNLLFSQEEKAQISFEKTRCDFGKISSMKKDTVCFYFENTGSSPLIIQKVTTTCGCTVSDWTKLPVESMQKGYVRVVFNPKGYNGRFSKSIFVKSNAETDVVLLKITGEVIND